MRMFNKGVRPAMRHRSRRWARSLDTAVVIAAFVAFAIVMALIVMGIAEWAMSSHRTEPKAVPCTLEGGSKSAVRAYSVLATVDEESRDKLRTWAVRNPRVQWYADVRLEFVGKDGQTESFELSREELLKILRGARDAHDLSFDVTSLGAAQCKQ